MQPQSLRDPMLPTANGDAILEAHMDELRHPDPAGAELFCFLRAVEQHNRGEASSVATYRRLLRDTTDPTIRVVMDMLVRDEARHHRLLRRIAKSLQEQLTWQASPDALTPVRTATSPEKVRSLEQEERRGAVELRELAARQRSSNSELACLLLETMALESEKHALLLSFVGRRLRTACHAG
jgi:rubrerythrin